MLSLTEEARRCAAGTLAVDTIELVQRGIGRSTQGAARNGVSLIRESCMDSLGVVRGSHCLLALHTTFTVHVDTDTDTDTVRPPPLHAL